MKNLIILFVFISSLSSIAQKNENEIIYLDKKYITDKPISLTEKGKLSKRKAKKLRKAIGKELNIEVKDSLPIVVTFYQKDGYCLDTAFNATSYIQIFKNVQGLSEKRIAKYQSQEFFIYTNDVFHKDLFEKHNEYVLDKGFFKRKIFKSNINCHAYYILKPNGDYFLYFVSDGSSYVLDFLDE